MIRIPSIGGALALVSLALAGALPRSPAADEEPRWIWIDDEHRSDQEGWFRKGFQLPAGKVVKATLEGSCDNATRVHLNGDLVAESTDWARPFRIDVKASVKRNRNTLAAWGKNEGGPAGLWLRLEIELEDGTRVSVTTDDSWEASPIELDGWHNVAFPGGWGKPVELGALGVAPWGTPTEFADGRGARALEAEALELPPGFEAELLYSVPKALHGSWVSLTPDDSGRLITSDQYGKLYRFTPPAVGETLDSSDIETIDVPLGRAHGLLYAFDALYVVVAEGQGTGLYRVRDIDGDDRFDDVEMLKAFDGSGEHGPHAVILGPYGESLYVVGGNHTRLPEGISRSRVPEVWAEDQLLPRRQDPNGHAVGVMAPGGWVCKTDPLGDSWELVACGMRNAYDIAFHDRGELFTFDSDMEWDVGLPWYKPTRVLHLVSGADFGWRHGSGKWPEYYPDSLPSVVDIGLSSPTGVVSGGAAYGFPREYWGALFVADWSYGTVYAVYLSPEGTSYSGSFEPFLSGKPLPVTDLVIGKDGQMYLTTGGRRTQSGLYRVRWAGEDDRTMGSDPLDFDGLPRMRLEAAHGVRDADAIAAAWPELANPDRFVRHAARTALEHQFVNLWKDRALEETDTMRSIQALLALVRVGDAELRPQILESLARIDLASLDPDTLLDALRVYGLVFIRMGGGGDDDLADRLDALFPAEDWRVNRELCRMLVYLGHGGVAKKALRVLAATETQEERIYYLFTLRTLEAGWTPSARRKYFELLNAYEREFDGGHSLKKYISGIRSDAVERVPDDLRERLADYLAPPPVDAKPVEAAVAKFVREWRVNDVVPYLDDVAKGRDFERGRKVYESTRCLECHRIGGIGGGTGPDLTGASGRFSARDLLVATIEPSETISDQYQETEIVTKDDELVVGRVEDEDDEWITLRTLPPEEELVDIAKTEITIYRPHALSRMPSGLVDSLERDEILDLLAYVLAGGEDDHPAFQDR